MNKSGLVFFYYYLCHQIPFLELDVGLSAGEGRGVLGEEWVSPTSSSPSRSLSLSLLPLPLTSTLEPMENAEIVRQPSLGVSLGIRRVRCVVTRSHGHIDTDRRSHGHTDTRPRRLAGLAGGLAGGRTPASSSPCERRAEAEPSSRVEWSPMTPSLITRKRPKFGASSSRSTSTAAARYGRTRIRAHAAAHTADPSLHGSLTISAFFGQGRGGGGGGGGRPSAGGGGEGIWRRPWGL